MRILWTKANKIFPVHSGGNIRSYHIARKLALHHELVFFSYYGGKPDPDYEQELCHQFPEAVCLCAGERGSTSLERGLDYVAHLPMTAPYAVSRFKSARVQDRLAAWFEEKRFDAVVCDFLDAALNFPSHLAIPTVLFQHNVESEIWRRHTLNQGNPAKRLFNGTANIYHGRTLVR